MVRAHKQTVTIQPGGRVEIASDQLPVGRQAEVIVLVNEEPREPHYQTLFGSGKGGFSSPAEADASLRKERDRWED